MKIRVPNEAQQFWEAGKSLEMLRPRQCAYLEIIPSGLFAEVINLLLCSIQL